MGNCLLGLVSYSCMIHDIHYKSGPISRYNCSSLEECFKLFYGVISKYIRRNIDGKCALVLTINLMSYITVFIENNNIYLVSEVAIPMSFYTNNLSVPDDWVIISKRYFSDRMIFIHFKVFVDVD
jgi:hypothetical protein